MTPTSSGPPASASRTLDLDRSPPPGESLDPPVLDATAVRAADEPDEIYEYP